MIPLIKEPTELYKKFKCYENCTFCKTPTSTWHHKTNHPVCHDCAEKHKVFELINYLKSEKYDIQ